MAHRIVRENGKMLSEAHEARCGAGLTSCFGSAGQHCLPGSVLVPVGDRVRQDAVVDAFIRSAGELILGDGLDDTATLCPW